MTITVLTSASGSPGVTTTAVGLTVHWPGSCLLVDTDYQKSILTGYLEGSTVTPNGLIHVINAARTTSIPSKALWQQAVPLPDDDPESHRRMLLPGLDSPNTMKALAGSWKPVAEALRALELTGIDMVVDLGRLTPAGIPPALLTMATHVLLMTKPTVRSVGACHWAARRITDQATEYASSARLGLLIVRRPLVTKTSFITRADPTPRGYDNVEIEAFLPLKVRGTITHDPVHAALLSDGGPRSPKFARSAYAASLTGVAEDLAQLNPTRRAQPQAATENQDLQDNAR